MASALAAEIAARPVPEIEVPEPLPLTATSILESSRRKEYPSDPLSVAKQLHDLVADPEKMMSILDQSAEHLDDHDPEMAQDVRIAMSRMIGFLASKAPKSTPSAPGMPPIEPDKIQAAKFERYLKAATNPTSILDDAERGDLMPESIEAVRTVYPNVYLEIQSKLADRIINAPSIPYRRKMQLSALLGQDMTGTLNPRMFASAQAAYAPAAPQQTAGGKVPVSRIKDMNVSGRAGQETAAWREAQQGARLR